VEKAVSTVSLSATAFLHYTAKIVRAHLVADGYSRSAGPEEPLP